ncbi:MAG: hypothetical protein NT062_10455 [Proteobacteria bacterium]|nr:hypothetical protein [Pseudomonadota bacterium]
MMRLALLVTVALGCGDDARMMTAPDATSADAASADAPVACLPTMTLPVDLVHGAFPVSPDHPSAIVHVPANFDPTPPVDVVVYIHGFSNCITNVIGDVDTACTPGGAARSAFQLAAQLAASQRNAILVVPEVRYDQASGDPGALGTQDGLRALLEEALGHVAVPLADVGRVIVASHSGGYRAVAAMATIGGVPVDELWLFDSLYGETTRFDAYVNADLASFATLQPLRRFADIYSTSGGTLANSEAMADRAVTWVTADPSVLVDDRTTATWPDDVYHHGLLFKHSGLSHDGVARYYFERMLATSALRTSRCN